LKIDCLDYFLIEADRDLPIKLILDQKSSGLKPDWIMK
jgi:hypothetical protein